MNIEEMNTKTQIIGHKNAKSINGQKKKNFWMH